MKINYPLIASTDVREGDIVLEQVNCSDGVTTYHEFTINPHDLLAPGTYYLIERPREVFPGEYGDIILAKKVRGVEFPDGVALTRQRGGHGDYAHTKPYWKSIGMKIMGADNHGENHIEDWVLAKVVPA